MKRWIAVTAALALAGCVTADSSVSAVAYDDWDYGFRYGIYDDYYGAYRDIDIDRGDLPLRPDRPLPPIAGRPLPANAIYRPAGVTSPGAGSRSFGGAGSLRGPGGGGGFGGGGRR